MVIKQIQRISTLCAWIFFPGLFLCADHLAAQDWRLSVGYSAKNFSLDIEPNPNFSGEIPFTQKGQIEFELERYLLYRLYISIHGDYLVHNDQSIFLDGTINFNHTSFGTRTGLQWNRLGVYAGAHAGALWNMEFIGEHPRRSSPLQLQTAGRSGTYTAGFAVGAKYYLRSFARITAELRHTRYLADRFEPDPEQRHYAQASSVRFTPLTFTAGISISLHRHSRDRIDRINRSGRLPLLMEVSGVRFGSPLARETVVTSQFGPRWSRMHEGIDLRASRGDDVVAAASGVVVEARVGRGYGNMVVIRHGASYTTTYAHLNSISVRQGQSVRRGEKIGTAGDTGVATGVHLHFEVRRDGQPVNPESVIQF